MSCVKRLAAMVPVLAISFLTLGTLSLNIAAADDAPPANSAPPTDAPKRPASQSGLGRVQEAGR